MGCVETKQVMETTDLFPQAGRNIQRMPLSKQKEIYLHNHEAFSLLLLNKEIYNSFNDANTEDQKAFDAFISSLYAKFYSKFTDWRITQEGLKDIILQQILLIEMEDTLGYRTISIQSVLAEILSNNEEYINKEHLSQQFSITSRRYFKENQKVIMLKQLINVDLKHVFSNLKFNSKFQFDSIKVILSQGMINEEMNMINIAEILIAKPKLTSACLMFQSLNSSDFEVCKGGQFGIDPEQLNHLHYIFNAIAQNHNISALCLCSYEDYQLSFPKNPKDSFIALIKKDNLFALGILKITFSPLEIQEILNAISSLNNLKFLVLEMTMFTVDHIKTVVNILKKNKKILSCFVSGGNLDINSEEEEQAIKKVNPNFKCFCYTKKLNINFD